MRIGIVTGGNRGIGFEVVRGLVLESDLDKIILCSRSIKNGEEAVQKLQDEFGQKSSLCEVAQLDLANGESIENFAAYIKENAFIETNLTKFIVLKSYKL